MVTTSPQFSPGGGMAVPGSCLHRIRASLHIIAQGFGFTRDFLKERNNSAYCRLKKIPCEFKQQARAGHPGENCGLAIVSGWCYLLHLTNRGHPFRYFLRARQIERFHALFYRGLAKLNQIKSTTNLLLQ